MASTLLSRWRLVLAGLLLGVASGILVYSLAPREYVSTVTIFVSARSSPDNATAAYQGSLLSEQRVKSYTQLVRSGRVLDPVIRQLALPETREELASKVSAKAQPDTVLLDVSVTDREPGLAADTANAVGNSFLGVVSEVERGASPGAPPAITAQVVDAAGVPIAPSAPSLAINLGAGFALGLILGCMAGLAREALDVSVRSKEKLETDTGRPVLAEVPFVNSSQSGSLKGQLVARREESYRQLRTNIQFLNPDSSRTVLLVTSAVEGEGKTTTSSELARVLALLGNRVILVDCDLRRPQIGDRLNVDSSVGLTSVISGRVHWREAVQRSRDIGLDVLASGPIPPNPSELLASRQMHDLLPLMRELYDYVILDAPPIGPVTDARALSVECDNVLLVVRHGSTSYRDVAGAISSLSAVGSSVSGFVLNVVPNSGSSKNSYYTASVSDAPGAEGTREIVSPSTSVRTFAGGSDRAPGRPSPRPRPSNRA